MLSLFLQGPGKIFLMLSISLHLGTGKIFLMLSLFLQGTGKIFLKMWFWP